MAGEYQDVIRRGGSSQQFTTPRVTEWQRQCPLGIRDGGFTCKIYVEYWRGFNPGLFRILGEVRRFLDGIRRILEGVRRFLDRARRFLDGVRRILEG